NFLKSLQGRFRSKRGERGHIDNYDATQMALAKLGDDQSFKDIIADLDSPYIDVQYSVLEKLKYIGGKKSFKVLYRLLDDDQPPPPPRERGGDVAYYPLAIAAMNTLYDMVRDPPPRTLYYYSTEPVPIWKKWFENHKELLE